MSETTVITIDRSKWYRGKGSDDSALVVKTGNGDNKYCCLGLACKQLVEGFDDALFLSIAYPTTVELLLEGHNITITPQAQSFFDMMREKYGKSAELAGDAELSELAQAAFAHINDATELTDDQRETKLQKLMEMHSDGRFKFEFIN